MYVRFGAGFVTASLLGLAIVSSAQQTPDYLHPQPRLLNAFVAEYPPAARAAHVFGDVHLRLMIRKDGSVESADIVDGPSMLHPASIAGAKNVIFDCTMCTEQSTPYELTMRFQITPTIPPENCDEAMPQGSQVEVDSLEHVVTVSTPEIWTCDPLVAPAIVLHRVRAARCMYLWRCEWRSKK